MTKSCQRRNKEDRESKRRKKLPKRLRFKQKKRPRKSWKGKKVQEKLAKEAARATQQQIEEENRLKKQQKKAVAEPGWETQKVKEHKPHAVKPLDTKHESKTLQPSVEKTKATVQVPKHLLWAIIGPKGVNIIAITKKTNVHITTPKEDNPGPILIEGDEKGVAAAKNAIESILKTGMSSITHPGSVSGKVQLTDQSQIGIIIGPQGRNIQRLKKELNVDVKMPGRDAARLTVTISGGKEQVKQAKQVIEDLMYLGYSKITHPEDSVLEVAYPSASVGRLIGPRGQSIKSIQGNTKCKITIPKVGHPQYKPDTVLIVGPAAMLPSAKKQVLNTLIEKEQFVEKYEDPNDPNYDEEPAEEEW